MNRIAKFSLVSLLCLVGCCLAVQAQRFVASGQIRNAASGNPLEYVSAVLLRPDSSIVANTMTDDKGSFRLTTSKAGKYIIKVSSIGMHTLYKDVDLSAGKDSVNVGVLSMSSNDNVLGTAEVVATLARVEQKDDTTMYNAGAYRVPEGSTLEALVKQLPGIEVEDDGTIKWKGKEVKEFLINGKDFFKGDTKVAMKNLPTELVSKIKAYDKASDYTEMTGIDDGEETTVLDIMTKRQLNESWVTNVDLAYGSKDRYAGRFFVSRFTDNSRVSAYGSANNTNDRGFGGPRGWGGGGGLTATKSAGLDFSWENGKKKREAGRFEAGGNVNYYHRGSDVISLTSSETFLTSGKSKSFAESNSLSRNTSTSVSTSLRLQWNPDTMTNLSFRPSYSYSESNGSGRSLSATFNEDPNELEGMYTPLDSMFVAEVNPDLLAIAVNRNQNHSLSDSKSHNVSGAVNATRRLNTAGRNVSFRASAGYSKSESHSFSLSDIEYYRTGQPNSFRNQYNTNPTKNWNYSLRLGYVEPLGKQWFGELNYNYKFRYQDRDRDRYRLDNLGGAWADALESLDRFGTLPTVDDWMNLTRDDYNSQYATYKYYNHSFDAGVRYNTETIRFNAGVEFNPEKTKMSYTRLAQGIDTLITRDVFNVSPSLRFRYRFSKTTNLDIRYRGSSSQPSMTDLLAVVDNSNPLNVSMGNPGLKPSWTNNLNVFYNTYNVDLQRTISYGLSASQTSHSVSNRIVYDEESGVRYSRPENINGDWNARGHFMLNTPFNFCTNLTISTFTNISYSNRVGYVSSLDGNSEEIGDAVGNIDGTYDSYDQLFRMAAAAKNTTRTLGLNERLAFNYRTTWFDAGIHGRVNYQHARASLQENANMDTWNYSYGADLNFNLPWGMSLSTDISMSSRRGYAAASMNTDEILWNAQISQSFLRNRAATLSLQFYDILHEQSNVSRTLNAMQRSDTWTNAINSYFLVHFIYRLNIFGGSKAKKDGDSNDGPRDRRPGGQGPMHPMPMMRMGGRF